MRVRAGRSTGGSKAIVAACLSIAACFALYTSVGYDTKAEHGALAATPTPVAGRLTLISRSGNTYFADAQWGGQDYSGTSLKVVGEGAMYDLDEVGGGSIRFQAGIFDLGPNYFQINGVQNVEFAGQGIDVTFIRNSTNAADDTEPFNVTVADALVVRDMTVSAGGTPRTTSDALDFDSASNSRVERVKVVASRARGIIFDGKGAGQEANKNVIRDCVVTGTPGHGIELLAADNNRIENCTISNVAGHGIQISKSSPVAATPNEPSNDNVIIGNTVEDAALDGINVLSSNRNRVLENTVSGSGRDGVRLDETDLVPCDDSFVYNNTSSDNSKWGLNIESPLCHETTAGANVMTGNGSGPFRDTGTGTVLTPPAPNPDYDGDTRPNGVDNCPTVANNRQKDSDGNGAGDHCDPGDFDRDGYSDENEARFIGTNADYACSVHWPSNLYNAPPSTNRLDVQDVTSFLSPVRRLNTNPGESGFSGRWDLQPGPGAFPDYINILDVTGLFGGLTGFPPMFGGAPAFNRSCVP